MGFIAGCGEDGECLVANLQRFAPAEDMVVIVGCFDEGACEQGEMALPEAGDFRRTDRGPSAIGLIQLDLVRGQDKVPASGARPKSAATSAVIGWGMPRR